MIITKIADIVTNPQNITKFHRISGLLYIISILLFICLPYFSQKDGITEKNLRNTDIYSSNLSINQFEQNSYEFLQNLLKFVSEDKYISKYSIIQKLFENLNINKEIFDIDSEKVYSFNIPSLVNERNKYILITFIYDTDGSLPINKNLYLVYNLLKYFENKDNYRWIAKDIKILLVSKDLYANKPKNLTKLIEDSPYFTETKLDFALNFEIDDDLHDSDQIILGISGKNSENIDLDFYKLIMDNLSLNFMDHIRTFEDSISEETKTLLESSFRFMDDSFVKMFASQFTTKPYVEYEKNFIYLIESVIECFLKPKPLNFNHLLISKNFNSLSITTLGGGGTRDDLINDKHFFYSYKKKIQKNFQFFQALEKIIRGMNFVELQIFRGNYNYIMTSPSSYITFEIMFIIPLFAGIQLAYKVLENLQKLKFENVDVKKISTIIALLFFFYMFMFLEIGNYSAILKQFNFNVEEYYLFILILILCYAINVVIFKQILKFNKSEFMYFETIKMFLVAIMSYNIFMINYGIGLIACLFLYSFELIYSKLNEKYQKTRHQAFLCMKLVPDACFVYMALAEYDEYFYEITHNYLNYSNHTYSLFALFYVLSVFNLTCTVISLEDKFSPIVIKHTTEDNKKLKHN